MPSVNWQTDLQIDLDKVPKKYAGLDGTEIAISESQERMAVVVDPKDVDEFMSYAAEENLEAVRGSSSNRRAETGADLERKRDREYFPCIPGYQRCASGDNGSSRDSEPAKITILTREEVTDVKEKWLETLKDLNVCSQKGLVEMFDGSIGAGYRVHAVWWKISADRDTGNGCKASGTEGKTAIPLP